MKKKKKKNTKGGGKMKEGRFWTAFWLFNRGRWGLDVKFY